MKFTEENIKDYIGKKWIYVPDRENCYIFDRIINDHMHWTSYNNTFYNKGNILISSFINALNRKNYKFIEDNNYEIY